MRLFTYYGRRKLWMFPIILFVYLILMFFQAHGEFSFFHQCAEQYPSLLVALLSSFVLTSDTENEFAKCYGVKFTNLAFSQWMPHFFYPLLIAFWACPFYFILYKQGWLHGYFLPVNDISYGTILFSLFVTFFLVSSFSLLVRVLLRNIYGTFGAVLITFSPFYLLHNNLILRKVPMEMAKYDIWITGLLYSDLYSISMDQWIRNRFICLIIAICFVFSSFLILRQKNYKNIH